MTQDVDPHLIRHLGGWDRRLAAEYRDSPVFFDRFLAMLKVPGGRGALPPVDQALIGVAVVGNVAYSNWPRLEAYVTAALELGATREQVRDVLRTVSIMSIHAGTVGIPALATVLRERGIEPPAATDPRRVQLRAEFERRREYWHETWDDMLSLDPDLFEAYTDFSMTAAEHGALDAKLRELIYIAIDCVITHLYVPGVEIHARRALDLGATPDEIVTAIEIAALTGSDLYFEAIQRIPGLAAEPADT